MKENNTNKCKCNDPEYETVRKIIEHEYIEKTYKQKGEERIGMWCKHCDNWSVALKFGRCTKYANINTDNITLSLP